MLKLHFATICIGFHALNIADVAVPEFSIPGFEQKYLLKDQFQFAELEESLS